jgi:hypothetical protein
MGWSAKNVELWMTNEWRDKRQVWWRAFRTEAEALEATRLRE